MVWPCVDIHDDKCTKSDHTHCLVYHVAYRKGPHVVLGMVYRPALQYQSRVIP